MKLFRILFTLFFIFSYTKVYSRPIINFYPDPNINNLESILNNIKTAMTNSEWADITMLYGDLEETERNIYAWSGSLIS